MWPLFFSPFSERFLVPLLNQVFPSCLLSLALGKPPWPSRKSLPAVPYRAIQTVQIILRGFWRQDAVEPGLWSRVWNVRTKINLQSGSLNRPHCVISSPPSPEPIVWPLAEPKPAPWHVTGALTCGTGSQSFPTPTTLAKQTHTYF